MLIYLYEAQVREFFVKMIPNLRACTYSPKEEMLGSMMQVKEYPSLIYAREQVNWEHRKPLKLRCTSTDSTTTYIDAHPFIQKYTAKIFVESQRHAIDLINRLKTYWRKHYHVYVTMPNACTLPISLSLLSCGITDERLPNDKIGACRIVEVQWQSQLFYSDVFSDTHGTTVDNVEEVHIDLASMVELPSTPGTPSGINNPANTNVNQVDPTKPKGTWKYILSVITRFGTWVNNTFVHD